jgi:hypothetical protein
VGAPPPSAALEAAGRGARRALPAGGALGEAGHLQQLPAGGTQEEEERLLSAAGSLLAALERPRRPRAASRSGGHAL